MRKEGDGWTDGSLKVIAGILGLSFGELKDREVARARARARVRGAIAVVFALLAVIAGVSAWRAVEETRRAEAQLSRVEAAILVAVERVAKIVDQVAAGSESGAIPTALAKSLLTTADGMVAGVVALAPHNPRLLLEQGGLLSLFLHVTTKRSATLRLRSTPQSAPATSSPNWNRGPSSTRKLRHFVLSL